MSRRGRPVVVVIGIEEYRRLHEGEPDLKRFLMEGPDLTVLDIVREGEPARRVEF